MFTREQYLRNEVTHREYYGQFVTPRVRRYVKNAIGMKRLKASTDEHLNDIPLTLWDNLTHVSALIDRDLLRAVENWDNPKTYPWSLSAQVCIAKEAAHQILEAQDEDEQT